MIKTEYSSAPFLPSRLLEFTRTAEVARCLLQKSRSAARLTPLRPYNTNRQTLVPANPAFLA